MTQPLPGAGEIRRDSVYTVREFCRRTKICRHTIRKHIKPRIVAGKAYIIGREFCDLVEAAADSPEEYSKKHREQMEPEGR